MAAFGINDKNNIVGQYVLGRVTPGSSLPDPVPIISFASRARCDVCVSQVLGVNDSGIAVGYYGDSTTSQHGFFYNTNTGEIAGFY